MKKLEAFPKLTNKDSSKLYDLSDILSEIEGLKSDPKYSTTLSYFDSAAGILPIISKLPHNLQEKWMTRASDYKKRHQSSFPLFHVVAEFVNEQSRIRNDPSFKYDASPSGKGSSDLNQQFTATKRTIDVKKTEVASCPFHNKAKHSLSECYEFKKKSSVEKSQFLKENGMCFKCVNSKDHKARECSASVKCEECGSKYHRSIMHQSKPRNDHNARDTTEMYVKTPQVHGGEPKKDYVSSGGEPKKDYVSSKRTEIDQEFKSCSKIVLVDVFSVDNLDNVLRCYAIVDEQSNKTLARPELFDKLHISGTKQEYVLNSCAGPSVKSGRRSSSCIVRSCDGLITYKLPTIIECDDIPSSKQEICTSRDIVEFPHLSNIVHELPHPDDSSEILLLLGRDLIDAHQVQDQIVGPPGTPFAQRIGLGWVVVGELCVGEIHASKTVNVNKISVLPNGRPSLFKSCEAVHAVVENCYSYDPVFVRKSDDNQPTLSVDDHQFLQLMDDQMHKDDNGNWVAPLPFREPRERLPNNREMALRRARTLHSSLSRNPEKQQQMLEFMSKIIDKGHAEIAPQLSQNEECWFLPVFGVTHPQKPGQVRGVFDSSAQYQGLSLNSVLLCGPDLNNSLLGVLMRFRNEQVPVMADIEQMFYCFRVTKDHRNFLRFWWYKVNNPGLDLIEYRMCVHVFGNSPSPAVATYGLRKSVENSNLDVKQFVTRDFYVDDGIASRATPDEIVDLIKRTQIDLARFGIRLHKIASSNVEVMKAFDVTDLAQSIRCLDIENECLPIQHSLGLNWDLDCDCFTFKVKSMNRPLTRRGILATVNSLFDPLGFVAPISLVGKLILRELMSSMKDWDETVPDLIESKFLSWRDSLKAIDSVQISRCHFNVPLDSLQGIELHIFSDASELAISSVAYIVGVLPQSRQVSFLMGKSKGAPNCGNTIPRLELCAAVLGVEMGDAILKHIGIPFSVVRFYTDSRVVLGYINNQSRRFYTYVGNRTQRIRQSSSPQQWNYVCSSLNPADIGSRGSDPEKLNTSLWFTGPRFLYKQEKDIPEFFPLIHPNNDSEIRPVVQVLVTDTKVGLCTFNWIERFERFSSWERLIQAISLLKLVVSIFKQSVLGQESHHGDSQRKCVETRKQAKLFVLQKVQLNAYHEEIECLQNYKPVPRHSSILSLDPFLDADGLLKVGGRLRRSSLSSNEKHPIILSGKQHVAKLLVHHFHTSVQHQGRLFTEGAIRSGGYWITGGKRLVGSLIFNCVICKKLRGHFKTQKMSDLPKDRIEAVPPFSHIGVDVFGPWEVVARKTRGGHACSKRWAVMFTCLNIRAVHIEVIAELTSSAFINALRRFVAVRGSVKEFRSDRGTNFVGATDSLKIDAINVEDETTKTFLYKSDCVWLFNPPHSSHFGGSWERMIGISRRILDSMLRNSKNLTHDVLVTVLAEISAIINARPIVPVSSDVENPEVLSPSVLLTQKMVDSEQFSTDIDVQVHYKDQWKQVQSLANQFWGKWRREYLQTLQSRRKWTSDQSSLEVGDVVLLKEKDVPRNCWPMGLVSRVFPSQDGSVRKVELVVSRDGKRSSYIRPIVNMVLLVKSKS